MGDKREAIDDFLTRDDRYGEARWKSSSNDSGSRVTLSKFVLSIVDPLGHRDY
jgi:hypothetical protein